MEWMRMMERIIDTAVSFGNGRRRYLLQFENYLVGIGAVGAVDLPAASLSAVVVLAPGQEAQVGAPLEAIGVTLAHHLHRHLVLEGEAAEVAGLVAGLIAAVGKRGDDRPQSPAVSGGLAPPGALPQ